MYILQFYSKCKSNAFPNFIVNTSAPKTSQIRRFFQGTPSDTSHHCSRCPCTPPADTPQHLATRATMPVTFSEKDTTQPGYD